MMTHRALVEVTGVQLLVVQEGRTVTISKVIGKDRKRGMDITRGRTFKIDEPAAMQLIDRMKKVAAYRTEPCRCGYSYGYSDHAEHCKSIYKAEYDGCCVDDD